jgi:hypothetical protein
MREFEKLMQKGQSKMIDEGGKMPTCSNHLFFGDKMPGIIVLGEAKRSLNFFHGPVGVLNSVSKQKTESF